MTRRSCRRPGTRAAFIFFSDYPLAVGSYTSQLFYEGVPVAAHRFAVKDNPPQQTELANFGVFYGDVYTRRANPRHPRHPSARCRACTRTGDLPPNSNLRLFWYDPDGVLVTTRF